jgi:hypothetical protein
MIRAQATTIIARHPSEVFQFVATDFFANYPRWSPEVVMLRATSPGPLRVGSTGWQARVDFGRRTELSFRVSILDECKRVDFQGISLPMLSSYRFVEINQRTRLTFLFELKRLDYVMRPFSGLINLKAQQGAQQVVGNIKRLLEAEIRNAREGRRRMARAGGSAG